MTFTDQLGVILITIDSVEAVECPCCRRCHPPSTCMPISTTADSASPDQTSCTSPGPPTTCAPFKKWQHPHCPLQASVPSHPLHLICYLALPSLSLCQWGPLLFSLPSSSLCGLAVLHHPKVLLHLLLHHSFPSAIAPLFHLLQAVVVVVCACIPVDLCVIECPLLEWRHTTIMCWTCLRVACLQVFLFCKNFLVIMRQ